MTDKVSRMKELVELLNKASELYYQKNTSMMTDFEYDKLYDELIYLEKETNMILSNSPTINVEPEISSSLETVEHPFPMLSLSKTKDVDELVAFLSDKEGLLSWKLDGLTIVLTYQDGSLVSGVTRGTGVIGEVVTNNVKQFKNIPLNISYKGKLVLRGEAVIKYSDFNKINEQLGDGTSQYKNPRNLCSGSVRQLDSSITASRMVNCIIFSLIQCDEQVSNSKKEQFEWLESLGFEVVERVVVNEENIKEVVENYKEKVKVYDIPSDGLVLTYDDEQYGLSLGSTAKFPRHSIAFKWKDETSNTVLEAIDWKVSRTGLINPVAIFKPVELEGTIVSRASLHNVSILKALKLGIGDTISLYCMNEFCVQKLIKRLSSFVSRDAMNIEGISDQILNRLIDEGLIEDFSDLYHLDNHKEKIINFDGFGEKSYNNMIESIEKSRNVNLYNFIFALGMPDIGLARAKLICKYFDNDINKILNATEEQLSSINGIGEIIAQNCINTLKNDKFLSSVHKLLKEITFNNVESINDKLANMNFVITGSLNKFKNRDELIEYIELNGGKVLKGISNNVNYLINNDITSMSSKNKKAKKLGISIITEDELIDLIDVAI